MQRTWLNTSESHLATLTIILWIGFVSLSFSFSLWNVTRCTVPIKLLAPACEAEVTWILYFFDFNFFSTESRNAERITSLGISDNSESDIVVSVDSKSNAQSIFKYPNEEQNTTISKKIKIGFNFISTQCDWGEHVLRVSVQISNQGDSKWFVFTSSNTIVVSDNLFSWNTSANIWTQKCYYLSAVILIKLITHCTWG